MSLINYLKLGLHFGTLFIFLCFGKVSGQNTGQNATITIVTSTLTTSADGRIHGWVHQPDYRGTIDIICTCLFTIFICTYTMLCLNLPSPTDRLWKIVGRKLFWMGVSIAGPEFVLTAAAGQWSTARESVKYFHAAGYSGWTIRHGFFADMGGFRLLPRGGPEFPINAKHLHWLVTNKVLDLPNVTSDDIDDRSKQDTIAKLITFAQVGYLIVQCTARAIQHLPVTTLELFALAIVACSILTSLCWLKKPLDVRTPIRLYVEDSMEEILELAGKNHPAAKTPWEQTPMDFVDDLRPSWNLNVQRFMHLEVAPFERPMPRIGNDRFPNLGRYEEGYLCFCTLGYAAIHLAGWNFKFPSHLELVLWRVSSLFIFGTTVVFWIFETMAARYRTGFWHRIFYRLFHDKQRANEIENARTARLERTAEEAGPPKELPLPAEFWSIFPLAVMYSVARLYMLVEAFIGLRNLERDAYLTVNWTAYIPHV